MEKQKNKCHQNSPIFKMDLTCMQILLSLPNSFSLQTLYQFPIMESKIYNAPFGSQEVTGKWEKTEITNSFI